MVSRNGNRRVGDEVIEHIFQRDSGRGFATLNDVSQDNGAIEVFENDPLRFVVALRAYKRKAAPSQIYLKQGVMIEVSCVVFGAIDLPQIARTLGN